MAGRNIKVEVLGDASGLSRALGGASASAGSFGKRMGSAGLTLARFGKTATFVAGGAALGGLALTLRAGIKEWSEHAKVAAQTNAVIRSTGGVANVTRQHVEELANSILQKTGIDDEQTQSTANLLLGYTNIRNELGKGNDVFDRATRLVTDYTVRTGKAAPAAVAVFGKALNDLGEGKIPTTLRGIGKLSDGLQKQMAAMLKAGDVTGAQGLLLETLEKRYQGAAEAAGRTLPGQLNKLRENFNNFAGDIAKTFGPAFSAALSAASGFLQKLSAAQGMRAKLNVIWEGASGAATSAFNALRSELGKVNWSAVWSGIKVNAQALADRFNKAVGDVQWGEVGKTIGESITKTINFGTELGKKLSGELAKAAAQINWQEFAINFAKGVSGSGSLSDRMKHAILGGLKFNLQILDAPALQVGKHIQEKIGEGATKSSGSVWGKVKGDLEGKVTGLSSLSTQASGVGASIGAAIMSGVSAGAAGAWQAAAWQVASYVQSVIQYAHDHAGSTPDQATAKKIGEPMAKGVRDGWASGMVGWAATAAANIRAVIARMAAAAAEARGQFISVFRQIATDALAAFDAKMAAWVPPSQKKLDALRADMAKHDVENAVTAAQAAAQAAQQAFDSATQQEGESDDDFLKRKQELYQRVLDADRDLKTAQRALIEYNLEQQAEAEKKAHDKMAAKKRESLAKDLWDVLKDPKKWDTAAADVVRILGNYDVKIGEAGGRWAAKFTSGLAEGLAQLQAALSAFLRASGVDTGPQPGMSGGGGGGGGPTDAGRRGGGRGTGLVVNVTVQGALLGSSVQQVAETIKREFINEFNANGPLGFYPAPS